MPALLDVLVGALVGEGLCPPGEGLCLSGLVCLPSVWALHAPNSFPFAIRVIYRCATCTQSLSLYHRVVSWCTISMTGSCLCPDLFPLLLSSAMYQCIACSRSLSSSLSFHQECINVYFCYLGMPIPRYLSSKEKSFKLTWNCPQRPWNRLKIVHKPLENCPQFVGRKCWIPLLMTPC